VPSYNTYRRHHNKHARLGIKLGLHFVKIERLKRKLGLSRTVSLDEQMVRFKYGERR